MFLFDRDNFKTSEYEICFEIDPLILEIFGSKVLKRESALECWTRAQASRVQSPSAEYFFLIMLKFMILYLKYRFYLFSFSFYEHFLVKRLLKV